MNTASRPLWGMFLVAGAATLWGTTGTSQALAGGTLSPAWFGALRLAFAALFFAIFAAFGAIAAAGAAPHGAPARNPLRGLRPRDVIGAGLCMALYNLAFFAGVRLTGVGLGTAIALGSGPVWAGLLQAVLHRQRPALAWWVGTGVAVAGGVLLSLGALTSPTDASSDRPLGFSAPGVLLCLACGLAYAGYTLLNKRMVGQAPAAGITLGAFGVAAMVSLPLAAWHSGLPSPHAKELLATAYAGVVTAGVGYLLFSVALRHITPATGVTLALVEPVVAFGLAVLLLGEPATALGLTGLALVVAGVWGVVRAELRPADDGPRPPRTVRAAQRDSTSESRAG